MEREHHCTDCKNSHLAALWYRRNAESGGGHRRTVYLCGVVRAALPPEKRVGWNLVEE